MMFTILSQFFAKVNHKSYGKVPNSASNFCMFCTRFFCFYIFWAYCFYFILSLFYFAPPFCEHRMVFAHRMGHARKECCDLNRYRNYSNPRGQTACTPAPRPMPRDCQPTPPTPAGMPPAMAYVPVQVWCETYAPDRALCRGTLFPALDLPFERGGCCR